MEEELKDLFENNDMDDEDISEDESMQIAGHINFEKNPLPTWGQGKDDISDEEDDEAYMQDIMKQQEQVKNDRDKKQKETKHDEEPRKPDSETDSIKARKNRENTAEQIVKDFEKKKDINYSNDERVEELAPEAEGEEDPEV